MHPMNVCVYVYDCGSLVGGFKDMRRWIWNIHVIGWVGGWVGGYEEGWVH